MKVDISQIATEKQNINTLEIDTLDTESMIRLINNEDKAVIEAVNYAIPMITKAVDATYNAIRSGGRLVYIGAGTSGRLGVLDASEILPTYGMGEEAVVGLIAGGDTALRNPVESAEDSSTMVIDDLKSIDFNEKDVLCAIASSGRTPYCIAGLEYAKSLGATTVALSCVKDAKQSDYADIAIEAPVGQEVITGSTRMKSGTATKLVLNMLSTATMVKLGKVYGNLMVDVKTSNDKLVERAKGIIMNATGASYERAGELLELSHKHVKTAIVMELTNRDFESAKTLLEDHEGHIREAIASL